MVSNSEALFTSLPNNRINPDCQLRCASLAAGYALRSASNGRLSWGEQAYNILSQYQAEYPAILDIATYLSLNKLLGLEA